MDETPRNEYDVMEEMLHLVKEIPSYRHRMAALTWLEDRITADEKHLKATAGSPP